MNRLFTPAAAIAALFVAACSKPEPPPAPPPSPPPAAPTAATAPAPAPTEAPAPASAEPVASQQAEPVAAATAPDGKAVYEKACFTCHAMGVAGAPKLGSKDDWVARISQGTEVLYKHSIEGFTGAKGVMPPRGGFMALSDDEVRAAVDYMVGESG